MRLTGSAPYRTVETMKPKNPFPTVTALSAMVRSGDDTAIEYVVSVVRWADGSIPKAAEAMSISERAFYEWRSACPKLKRALGGVARGRTAKGKFQKGSLRDEARRLGISKQAVAERRQRAAREAERA